MNFLDGLGWCIRWIFFDDNIVIIFKKMFDLCSLKFTRCFPMFQIVFDLEKKFSLWHIFANTLFFASFTFLRDIVLCSLWLFRFAVVGWLLNFQRDAFCNLIACIHLLLNHLLKCDRPWFNNRILGMHSFTIVICISVKHFAESVFLLNFLCRGFWIGPNFLCLVSSRIYVLDWIRCFPGV